MKIIATKARRRHQGFIFNKTFCVTLCLCVLVAIFIVAIHDVARAFTRRRMKTNTNGLRSI